MIQRSADQAARLRAIDIRRSCIVQAPAGSGKTELLTQRLLALLAVSERPEEVLAITFTRKAAGEMKQRVLAALAAAAGPSPDAAHAKRTWNLARQVLQTDRHKGWHLQENPARLQLLTIDSLCAYLTRRMPWLSRFGDHPSVTDQPVELYRLAVERLLDQLESDNPASVRLVRLLSHLDNRMSLLRDLLVDMLGRRDQWLRHVLEQRRLGARELLEKGLQTYIEHVLHQCRQALGTHVCDELLRIGAFAADNIEDVSSPVLALKKGASLSVDAANLDAWRGVAHLVLTGKDQVRKTVDRRLGFPAAKSGAAYEVKQCMKECLLTLQEEGLSREALVALRRLPASVYSTEQWSVLEALIEILPEAVFELKQVFQRRGAVDFIEIAGAAHLALGTPQHPEDLMLQLDGTLRHILVDEFQDTSYSQYVLLHKLTAGWQPDDGRTLFIVGDPMQSIYRFREADVGLFLRVCEQGLNGLPLDVIQLTSNFRSQERLVEWSNRFFGPLFPQRDDQLRGAVRFAPASAVHPPRQGAAVTFCSFEGRQDVEEARQLVDIVRRERSRDPDGSIAVLVRSRQHLQSIVSAFHESGLAFQAQDIDSLAQRPVVLDLLVLVRALLFPLDRIAWLAVLRAPWCGLNLADLYALSGMHAPHVAVSEALAGTGIQADLFNALSPDGRQRSCRVFEILENAQQKRGRLPLRQLVESTWLKLGGAACCTATDLLDVNQVFVRLESLDEGGDLPSLGAFEEALEGLYAAPDAAADSRLQLMTIHKAKGLEFDTVILPGLGRSVKGHDHSLLRWLEHPDLELLLAPIPASSKDEEDCTYRALGHIFEDREAHETLRLFYVAATRARSRLYLLGHVQRCANGSLRAEAGSFLDRSWQCCADEIETGLQATLEPPPVTVKQSPLIRLPADWAATDFAEALSRGKAPSKRASEQTHRRLHAPRTLLTEEGRVVGTLVHAWLQKIAEEGLSDWDQSKLEKQKNLMAVQLFNSGLPGSRHPACKQAIMQCLSRSLCSERGRWILSGYAEADCELELNGLVDGTLVHASIDRTFVDAGVRWVVDYKTSQPKPGEATATFLNTEAARYVEQLRVYASLLKVYDPRYRIRTALYFPAIDAWWEQEG